MAEPVKPPSTPSVAAAEDVVLPPAELDPTVPVVMEDGEPWVDVAGLRVPLALAVEFIKGVYALYPEVVDGAKTSGEAVRRVLRHFVENTVVTATARTMTDTENAEVKRVQAALRAQAAQARERVAAEAKRIRSPQDAVPPTAP